MSQFRYLKASGIRESENDSNVHVEILKGVLLNSENWPSSTFCSNENKLQEEVKSEFKEQCPVSMHVSLNENKTMLNSSEIIPCERFNN